MLLKKEVNNNDISLVHEFNFCWIFLYRSLKWRSHVHMISSRDYSHVYLTDTGGSTSLVLPTFYYGLFVSLWGTQCDRLWQHKAMTAHTCPNDHNRCWVANTETILKCSIFLNCQTCVGFSYPINSNYLLLNNLILNNTYDLENISFNTTILAQIHSNYL